MWVQNNRDQAVLDCDGSIVSDPVKRNGSP